MLENLFRGSKFDFCFAILGGGVGGWFRGEMENSIFLLTPSLSGLMHSSAVMKLSSMQFFSMMSMTKTKECQLDMSFSCMYHLYHCSALQQLTFSVPFKTVRLLFSRQIKCLVIKLIVIFAFDNPLTWMQVKTRAEQ